MSRVDELRRIREVLWAKFENASGSGAAAIALQLRILDGELERLEASEVSKADELAARRKTKGSSARPPSRRRQPRRGASGD